MIFAMLYPWLKALHVAAALVFVAGVVAASMFLRLHDVASSRSAANAIAFRRWDRRVTLPAMLLVWVLGMELAVTGHWAGGGWLGAKVCLVLLLSAIHGMQSAQLRRLSQGIGTRTLNATWLVLASVIGIAILVVVKPF